MKFLKQHWWVFIAAAIAMSSWAYTWFYFDHVPNPNASNADYYAWRGTFGDMFGVVNALFSAFTLIGVAYGISQQSNEIKESKNTIKLQEESAELNSFENTFFRMLEILIEITNQIDLTTKIGDGKIQGKDTFRNFITKLKRAKSDLARYEKVDPNPNFQEVYEYFYNKNNHDIGHYFRFLYNIYKFIDNSNVKNKKFYSDIVRAQMSDKEVALLFHNGLYKKSGDKFKKYIERYNLIKHVKDSDIIDPNLKHEYAIDSDAS